MKSLVIIFGILLQFTAAVKNPIISGCAFHIDSTSTLSTADRNSWNPDAAILRVGSNYFVATSSFVYFPGIPIYKSKDLANWELYSHALNTPEHVQLYGTPTGAGISIRTCNSKLLNSHFLQVLGRHP